MALFRDGRSLRVLFRYLAFEIIVCLNKEGDGRDDKDIFFFLMEGRREGKDEFSMC